MKPKTHKVKGKIHLNTKENCIICNGQTAYLKGGIR